MNDALKPQEQCTLFDQLDFVDQTYCCNTYIEVNISLHSLRLSSLEKFLTNSFMEYTKGVRDSYMVVKHLDFNLEPHHISTGEGLGFLSVALYQTWAT